MVTKITCISPSLIHKRTPSATTEHHGQPRFPPPHHHRNASFDRLLPRPVNDAGPSSTTCTSHHPAIRPLTHGKRLHSLHLPPGAYRRCIPQGSSGISVLSSRSAVSSGVSDQEWRRESRGDGIGFEESVASFHGSCIVPCGSGLGEWEGRVAGSVC